MLRENLITIWYISNITPGELSGVATALTDGQVYTEVLSKDVTNLPTALFSHDGKVFNESLTDQDAGVGTGNWTLPGGTFWSGKLSKAVDIKEVGDLKARVCLAVASTTIFADPQPRVA